MVVSIIASRKMMTEPQRIRVKGANSNQHRLDDDTDFSCRLYLETCSLVDIHLLIKKDLEREDTQLSFHPWNSHHFQEKLHIPKVVSKNIKP